MVAQPPGNISGEATTQSGNIFNEAMRHHQAARDLCSRVADDLDLSHQSNYLACVDEAMARALPKVEELARRNAPTPAIVQRLSK